MKTLHYRRHSLKDGAVKDTIGEKGLELARQEGRGGQDINYNRAFHGPLVRTAQTLLAFLMASGDIVEIMPVVEEIGTQSLFDEMVNETFKACAKSGLSNLDSLRSAHSYFDKVADWALNALSGVAKMFEAMGDEEVAIAFGHSPVIELAAMRFEGLPTGWDDLKELDGLVFVQMNDGEVRVIGVTRAKRYESAKS